MKFNKWTLALAAVGAVSFASAVQAEEQHQVMTALSSTTISGYVESSASWKPGSDGAGAAMPGRTFDGQDKQDGFNLHAVKLSLEKPLDEGQWSAGYKTDLIFGPDANYYGSKFNGGGGPNYEEFSVKQAYVALRAPVGNGLDIKLGVYDTLIGYEVFESGNNPNFSRSLGYAIEPTHHTGALLSYKINDMFSVSAGIANGWTGPVNDRAGFSDTSKTYLGAVTITLPESAGVLAGSSIYAGIVNGKSTATAGAAPGAPVYNGAEDTTSIYVGQTLNTPITGLSVGAAFDYRDNGPSFVAANAGSNNAWVLAGYGSFAATEKLKLNLRAEYAKGSDGTYFDGGTLGAADHKNRLGEITFTADYSLWANVLTRAEVRFDHAFGSDRPFGGTDTDRNALTFAADFVYKF
jgi:hypothetical protein